MKKGESKKGFTIIEVVLVLAVAGLIFTMVFIALPALQRSQRDNARRDDIMKFVSEVKRYQMNNRGALPGAGDKSETTLVTPNDSGEVNGNANTWAGFYHDYLGKNFIDPNGVYYKLKVVKCGAGTDAACNNSDSYATEPFGNYTLNVILQAKCDGTSVVGSSNSRNLAVIYRLEGSGAYCFNT